jgi:hypothetical protein
MVARESRAILAPVPLEQIEPPRAQTPSKASA